MAGAAGRRSLKLASGAIALAGIAAIAAISAEQGFSELGQVLATAGWGIAAVVAFHLVALAASTLAWKAVLDPIWRVGFEVLLWARLLREAVNSLLPVAQVGGEVVGARILTFHGAKPNIAGATVVTDVTIETATQVVFTILGVALLLWWGGGEMALWAFVAAALAAFAAAALVLAQRRGLFLMFERLIERLADRFDWPALRSFASMHDTLMEVYRNRRAVAAGAAWHLASWLLGAVEVWLALMACGSEAGFVEALILESLGQAIRSAAFVVPAGLGVQEGGFLFLGVFLGIPPEIALTVSLIKRIRDVVLGAPTMLAWQAIEARRLAAAVAVKQDAV
jgi:putative membrane protein